MHNETILIVDDSESNIDILIEHLIDYEVVVSLNATDALTLLEEQTIDLILLDIMMPDIDGFELCKLIKENPKTQEIPLLFITSKSDEESIEKGYDLGAVDYITKPFKPKELRSRIKTQLKLRSMVTNLEGLLDIEIQKYQEGQKQIAAQAKSAALGEMIDAIAHQWKQPLGIINMRINNLAFAYIDEKIDEAYIETFTQKTQHQISHLVKTMQEFRNFLKPSTSTQDFSTLSMINKTLLLMKDLLLSKQIECHVICNKDFIIHANESEFEHIIINIINNAKDAMIENSVENKRVNITIADSQIHLENPGGLIPEHILPHLFDANVSTKKSSGGSGTGLYLSKQIIEKCAGTLHAENLIEKNRVRFTLTLPLH
jgi:two-component system, sensor histidine kinase and response regulator